jgi:hypothetical protein
MGLDSPVLPASLAGLRGELAHHLREDAAEPYASAREHMLQIYRVRFMRSGRLRFPIDPQARHPNARELLSAHLRSSLDAQQDDGAWNEEDLKAFGWIDVLADSGHVGAHRLRERICASAAAVQAIARELPASIEPQLGRSPHAALALAQGELGRARPRFDAIQRWLESDLEFDVKGKLYGRPADEFRARRKIGGVMRELLAIAGEPCAEDASIMRKMLDAATLAALGDDSRFPAGKLLAIFAAPRLRAADAAQRAIGERLAERAAALAKQPR